MPQILFSNREGVFAVDSMTPGRYEVHGFEEQVRVFRFEVPANVQGAFDLGKITPKMADTKEKR